MRIPLDIIGDIAILKFPRVSSVRSKKVYALKLLKENKHLRVILEKKNKVSGRLRISKTVFLAGENRKETLHRENGCSFYLDVDKTYFSPRLSNERKIVSEDILKEIKKSKIKNTKILVMFAGVAPLPIVLAKTLKKSGISAKVISSELNRNASLYAKKNVLANKLGDSIEVIQGDSKAACSSFARKKIKFDFILMPRPNLKDSFLGSAFSVSKKETLIYYHGFGVEERVRETILSDAKKAKKKISRLEVRKAGEIGVKKYRFNVKFRVL